MDESPMHYDKQKSQTQKSYTLCDSIYRIFQKRQEENRSGVARGWWCLREFEGWGMKWWQLCNYMHLSKLYTLVPFM